MKKITQVVVNQVLLDGIEAYRKHQVGGVPSRSQAIRELLEFALRADAAEVASES